MTEHVKEYMSNNALSGRDLGVHGDTMDNMARRTFSVTPMLPWEFPHAKSQAYSGCRQPSESTR